MIEGIDPVWYREQAIEELLLKKQRDPQRRHFEPDVDPYSYTEILREPIPGFSHSGSVADFRVRKLCLGFWQHVVTPEIQLLRQATTGGLSGVARLLGQEFVQAPNGTTAEAFYMAYRGLDFEQWYAVCRKEKPIHFHPFGDAGFWLQLIYTILDRVLYPFHAVGFVHCDFKPDNVCIPFSEVRIDGDDITGYLDIGSVSLIDLGASVGPMDDAQGKRPHTGIVVAAQGDDHPLRYVSDYYVHNRESALQNLDGRADLYSLAYWLRDFLLDGAEGSGPWRRTRLKEAIRGDDTQRKALAALPGLIWDAADQYGQREPHPHPSLMASIRKVHIHSHDRMMFRVPLRLAERKHHIAPGWSVLKGYRKDVHLQSDARETVVVGAALTMTAVSIPPIMLNEAKPVSNERQRQPGEDAIAADESPAALARVGVGSPGVAPESDHENSQNLRISTLPRLPDAKSSRSQASVSVKLSSSAALSVPLHVLNVVRAVTNEGQRPPAKDSIVAGARPAVRVRAGAHSGSSASRYDQTSYPKPSTSTPPLKPDVESCRGQARLYAKDSSSRFSDTARTVYLAMWGITLIAMLLVAIWSLFHGKAEASETTVNIDYIESADESSSGNAVAIARPFCTPPAPWTAAGEVTSTVLPGAEMTYGVAFSPDGRRLISGSNDNALRLWDTETGEMLHLLRGHEHNVTSVAFSPDGRRLLSGSSDNTLRLWDAETGDMLYVLHGHDSFVWSVTFSPDGDRLLSGSEDGTLRLWDTETGDMLRVLHGHDGGVVSVAFSPDGRRLLSGAYDMTLRLWDAQTGEMLRELRGHENLVRAVAFSPNSRQLLSGSYEETLRLWDAETGVLLRELRGHERNVRSVAFSPDGRRLLSGSDDNTLRLWDAETGEMLRVLRGHTDRVNSVVFSPDGRRLLSGSSDGTLRLWDDPGATACTDTPKKK